MGKIPYFPFYPDDYLSSPGVTTCDLIDEGVYFRLLMYSWKHDGCQLPDDIQYLRRLCKGVRDKRLTSVLERHFEKVEMENGKFFWRNARLFTEFCNSLHRSEVARESINYRWNKGKHNTDVLPTNNERNTTITRTITNKEESKDTGKRKNRVPDSRVKEVIDYFHSQCQSVLGFAPAINGKQDGMRVLAALRVMPLPDVKKCIDFFLPSKKAKELGSTLSIALSTHTINLYKQGGSNGTRYDTLRSYFGLSGSSGADRVHSGRDVSPGSDNRAQAGRNAGAVLAGEAEEISEVETE